MNRSSAPSSDHLHRICCYKVLEGLLLTCADVAADVIAALAVIAAVAVIADVVAAVSVIADVVAAACFRW